MAYYSSRLANRQQRVTRRQAYLFLAGSMGLLIVLGVFGLPVLFNLTGTISGFNRKGTATKTADQGLAPTVPELSQDIAATNSAKTKITGFADAKTTIQLFHNDTSDQTAVSGPDGKFEFLVSLDKGPNRYQAQAIADSGNKSAKSAPYSVSFLTGNPRLEIASPKDSDSVSTSSVTISGQVDPGTSVAINDHLAIVDSQGNFQAAVNLQNGDNQFKITATDIAGNQTTKQLLIKSTATP